ncbi:hypothetical protein Acy02nite_40750 [Actinoplanes cyaneus]|uniref:Acyl-CoA dehydrogenase n=1 Tax=Actinoplanes cyaneus TaxID=52696 RepID=A0A919II59_9ACTN|nr:hypothetical protein [Actinoplanes cyaneus]MCW2138236.1 hypothetical protein [Actinoplanes cyaneus]GID66194.1 hypothetical protein Acy02nite_40750 [Actinoplanes cyaneus]
MTTAVQQDTARPAGAAAAVRALYASRVPAGVVVGPGGHAVTPEDRRSAGRPVDLPWLAGSGIRVVAGLGPPTVDRHPGWLLDLARLRLGLGRALLEATTGFLTGRGLIGHQLVRAALAEVVAEHLTVAAALDDAAAPDPADALIDAHERISVADRALLRLSGAAGYTVPGPGLDAHVSELLADVYLPDARVCRG